MQKRRLTIQKLGIFDDLLCREKTTNGVEEIFSLHWHFLGSYTKQTDYIMPFTVTWIKGNMILLLKVIHHNFRSIRVCQILVRRTNISAPVTKEALKT